MRKHLALALVPDTFQPFFQDAGVQAVTIRKGESYPVITGQYIVSLSGGVSSAVAADRAIERYGRENVVLWFADTLWEDVDLYRFLYACMVRWRGTIYRYVDGRQPLQVAEEKHIIPNNRIAPCTFELKIKPFRRFLKALPPPRTVILGLGWQEQDRMETPRQRYGSLPGVTVEYPLMWKPLEYRPYQDVARHEWGIEPPLLYQEGFPHNNCGGSCIKQGVSEMLRLRIHRPERFAFLKAWEKKIRDDAAEIGDPRMHHTICIETVQGVKVPITLEEIERRFLAGHYKIQAEHILDEPEYKDDRISCFCSYA